MADETQTQQQDQQETLRPEPKPEHSVPAPMPRERAALNAQASGVLPIIPTNIEEAQRYASGLIAAGIVPDAFTFRKNVLSTPEEIEAGAPPIKHRQGEVNAPLVLMGVLKAMELGVGPQTGLAGLLPLNGRFTVWGDLAAALVQSRGMVANQKAQRIGPQFDPDTPMGDWPNDYGWEVRYWRVGQPDPYIGTFTVREARRAGLWMNTNRDPWVKYPDRMLYNRARAFPLRDGFADALAGLSIAEEVMDTLPPVEEEMKQIETKRSLLTDDEPDERPATVAQEPAQAEEPEQPTDQAQPSGEGPQGPSEGGEQPSLLP